jgi:hypothetical protein
MLNRLSTSTPLAIFERDRWRDVAAQKPPAPSQDRNHGDDARSAV